MKENRGEDYVEYEVYSVIDEPTEEQFAKLDAEANIICFPELEMHRNGKDVKKLEFGLKIGAKTQE